MGSSWGVGNEASTMLQKFWDSAMAIGPLDDDDDSQRFNSITVVVVFSKCFSLLFNMYFTEHAWF